MALLVLHNAKVILEAGIQTGGVLVREGRITLVFAPDKTPTGLSARESIDLGGAYLAPGLIDIHIHGSAGVDVQATDAEGLTKLSEFLISEGVTGYLATLVPTSDRGYSEALATINSYVERQDEQLTTNKAHRGARILGVHFEGPFVNEHRCGALRTRYFRTYDGDPRAIESFAGSQSGIARLMTLAPETEHGLDLIRALATTGVRAFVGHSQADPKTLDAAAEAGARHITHFPNALDPLHHRKPGAVAWGLIQRDVTLDCIADLHHVDPLMLRLIYQSKGADRMALISDAIMPAGLGDGAFEVWDEKVVVRNGRTALAREHGEGTIAGSVITLRQAVKNTIDIGVPIDKAVRMASLVPARASGIQSEYGSIVEGKRADLIAFDGEFEVRFATIGGAVVFSSLE
jgi:N-acetylglucosamine-6-phosphate deacetylase